MTALAIIKSILTGIAIIMVPGFALAFIAYLSHRRYIRRTE